MTFTPSASALQPAHPTYNVKYKIHVKQSKTATELFHNTYGIKVSALRQRTSVSFWMLTMYSYVL